VTLTTEPPHFNIKHSKTQQQSSTPLHQQPIPSPNHNQHTTNTSEPTPFNSKPNNSVEFAAANKYSEPKINASKETKMSFEILNPNTVNSEIQENIFTVSKIGEGFNEFFVEASTQKEGTKYESDLTPISETTTLSAEKKVVRTIAVTPQIQTRLRSASAA
jgi:hypothetical protein